MSTTPELTLETFIILPFQLEWSDGKAPSIGTRADELKRLGWQPIEGHAFDPIAASKLSPEQIARVQYQAYNYFHPFVRAFWFNDDIVQRYRHPALHALEATLGSGDCVRFDACCDLLLFQPNIAVLILHLKGKSPLPLPTVEECLDQLRRVYPSYIATAVEDGHSPEEVRLIDSNDQTFASYDVTAHAGELQRRAKALMHSPSADDRRRHLWAPHWAELLQGIATQPGHNYALQAFQLGDDRAALASMLSIKRTAYQKKFTALIDTGHMARLCFADQAGTDLLPYSKRFLADFEARYCYDRFWYCNGESSHSPSRILNCGYAFTWLGNADDVPFFANENDGAPVTFRHIYVPMAIIAHLQKASLLVTARKLADLTPYKNDGALSPLDPESFDQIKRHFMAFTQTYWFEEITPQEQGIELYDMFKRHLRLQAHYEANRQAIQDIVEHIDTRQSERLNRIAQLFAVFGIALAILSLAVGLLGINTFQLEDNHATPIHLPHWVLDFINEGLVANVHLLTSSALILALAGTCIIFKRCIGR